MQLRVRQFQLIEARLAVFDFQIVYHCKRVRCDVLGEYLALIFVVVFLHVVRPEEQNLPFSCQKLPEMLENQVCSVGPVDLNI